MSSVDRRTFLTGAVLGSAAIVGATTFGGTDPAAAFRRDTSEIAAGAIDPGFAEGRVTSNRNGVLGVRGSDQILHRILVTSATSLWKMDPIPVSQVAVGDGLYARGARLPDGTLAADAVWVNLVNVDADISPRSARPGWISATTATGSSRMSSRERPLSPTEASRPAATCPNSGSAITYECSGCGIRTPTK
ncbi:hypothetical protein [Fodinicola feengrottensis]|uniref:hypothetical protein n=1 Tax=Fodinicola feengrottensis TaxID=435914 RepID=UPI0013D7F387|nr:hypothetical protein [Fodinicola feengrottensis]